MGYRRAKLYKLTFDDYPGLQVSMKGLSVKGLMAVSRHAAGLKGMENLSELEGEQLAAALAAAEELFRKFAAALVSWNLEDDETGEPVPATLEAVQDQDFDFILDLTLAWMDAAASVDTPLKQPSASSPPSGLGLSEAMEPLSPSPGSF